MLREKEEDCMICRGMAGFSFARMLDGSHRLDEITENQNTTKMRRHSPGSFYSSRRLLPRNYGRLRSCSIVDHVHVLFTDNQLEITKLVLRNPSRSILVEFL